MASKENINRFLFTLFGFQKTKSKPHLLLIILVHVSAWAAFLLLPLLFYPTRFQGDPIWRREIITKIIPITLFYVNYYFFLPRLFEKKRYSLYFAAVLFALVLVCASDIYLRNNIPGMMAQGPARLGSLRLKNAPEEVRTFIIDSIGPEAFPGMPKEIFRDRVLARPAEPALFFTINRTASTCLFLLLLGGMIRLAYSFIRNQNEKRNLENANLNAEVNFLKSQINPHFLFNTLNSIYSQAHARSENTEYSVLKLSELLRYSLYDSGADKVPLADDIQYIDNYIALQRLRLSSRVTLFYKVGGYKEGKFIAPLLLINLIENAFKHGISYTQPSTIIIDIKIFEETLTLTVSNPIVEKDSFVPGGLGLKNVTRRLELLYPNQYKLYYHHSGDQYTVNLKVPLTNA
ncbi:histidine kinase [Terrimonas sp. NA20]|uniref:Histidine kinase n=1 Tax=Terrimonas ginsenosidimutans TaxID=2908004 RepID=A0ABS9KNH8_9BACT|nr:histidine kinase [Terrimonas ginsenosidimutans]MCG2613883.1 histidine kinase [Terrimonas ginsenosidimutans]